MADKAFVAFDKLLAVFVKSTRESMDAALELANMCILHYAGPTKDGEKAGDTSMAEKFVNAMPKNYIRQVAFLDWMRFHSPLKVTGNVEDGFKLSKDKSPEAVKRGWRVDAAILTPFWEFKKADQEVKPFGSNDVVKALRASLKKFEDGEKFEASSKFATLAVADAKGMINKLAVQINDNLATAARQAAVPAVAQAEPTVGVTIPLVEEVPIEEQLEAVA